MSTIVMGKTVANIEKGISRMLKPGEGDINPSSVGPDLMVKASIFLFLK